MDKDNEFPIVTLWMGNSPENKEVVDLLISLYITFVAISIEGQWDPEILFRTERIIGLENIREFLGRLVNQALKEKSRQ